MQAPQSCPSALQENVKGTEERLADLQQQMMVSIDQGALNVMKYLLQ